MSITKDFQNEVAQKITMLFDRQSNLITQSQDWHDIPVELLNRLNSRDTQIIDERYYDYEQLSGGLNLPDNDATNLFIAKLITENEASLVKERIRATQNINKRSLRIQHLLECCSEPNTCYFDNDGEWVPIDHPVGNPIYSPILDLAIAPSIYMGANRKNPFITIYPLLNGPIMFEAFSRLSLVRRMIDQFERYAHQNYSMHGLNYDSTIINLRPLCLFGIEIENQINKKHLMGDFINSVMLSKYPIIIIPDRILNECLNMLRITEVIRRLKYVDIYNLLRKAIVLNVTQFRNVVDGILQMYDVEPLGVRQFN